MELCNTLVVRLSWSWTVCYLSTHHLLVAEGEGKEWGQTSIFITATILYLKLTKK